MKKCKVCNAKTESVFNIDFKAVLICEKCGTAIFAQQAIWYARENHVAVVKNRFHGYECKKVRHVKGVGYLHGRDDDGIYYVDGVRYCDRCHEVI